MFDARMSLNSPQDRLDDIRQGSIGSIQLLYGQISATIILSILLTVSRVWPEVDQNEALV